LSNPDFAKHWKIFSRKGAKPRRNQVGRDRRARRGSGGFDQPSPRLWPGRPDVRILRILGRFPTFDIRLFDFFPQNALGLKDLSDRLAPY
jgi:hypothetical protein